VDVLSEWLRASSAGAWKFAMEAKDENILQFSKKCEFSNRKFSHFSTNSKFNTRDPNPDSIDMDLKQRLKDNTVALWLAKRLAF
jgi:hypothetical protein